MGLSKRLLPVDQLSRPISTEEQLLAATVLAIDSALNVDEAEPMLSCDVCDSYVPADEISVGYVYGLETAACADCRGRDDT